MLNAGLQPVREEDEVAPLNSYLRWLPCVFDPAADKRQWYAQPCSRNTRRTWRRSGAAARARGIRASFFNRGGGPITFDPLNRLDRQMNAHLFLFGPTVGQERDAQQHPEPGDGDLPTAPVHRRGGQQLRPVRRLRGTVGPHRASVKLAPARASTWRRSPTPGAWSIRRARYRRWTPMRLDEDQTDAGLAVEGDEQRDVLGELEITARLMITGGEDRKKRA